ncbi:hypothetical protein DL96DRAFT_1821046 [Flagelloscypha sp. PMI_526]|nr:hypothetical protein DL96DRAFT_1821046 [Flagelloscypha sp. PMI_526]
MATPTVGTIQQHLDPILVPPPSRFSRAMKLAYWWGVYCTSVAGIMLPYNTLSCFLGRYLLDHFHLWDRTLPPGTDRSRGKDGELISAAIAAFIGTLLSLAGGLFSVVVSERFFVDPGTSSRNAEVAWFGVFYVPCCLLAAVGSMAASGGFMHARFHYVHPDTLLGVYAFGSLITFPSSLFIWWAVHALWTRWKDS